MGREGGWGDRVYRVGPLGHPLDPSWVCFCKFNQGTETSRCKPVTELCPQERQLPALLLRIFPHPELERSAG